MAGNPDDEQLNNPEKHQSEITPYQFIPTNGNEAVTQNLETGNMEIHHDDHSAHEKKTWKDFF